MKLQKRFIAMPLLFWIGMMALSQRNDRVEVQWPKVVQTVEILSSTDGTVQKAILYSSRSETPKPLIVSLHTWSGDYLQYDPLIREIVARDWNYIHPDFRGPNNHPEAGGSEKVISDLMDAINYALKNTNSDPEDVHIIGLSGGGFVTLAAYMNLDFPVKTFSAWAPISDLEAWYYESVGRRLKYARDIMRIVSVDTVFNRDEAIRRSPLWQSFPRKLREDANLFLYAGVHDGCKGSVPFTHSVKMYNRLAGELAYGVADLDSVISLKLKDSILVSQEEMIDLLTRRFHPAFETLPKLFDRNVFLLRNFRNIHLTIFDGGHEQLPQALGLIPYKKTTSLKYNILTLGDSNGEIPHGWVNQLKNMMPESKIINISKSGRTIGFDNLGRKELNALRNIDEYLNQAQSQIGHETYDCLVVCLGTNDAKKVFANRQEEVVANFRKLLFRVKKHQLIRTSDPRLLFVTPPPMRTYDILEKYEGGNERLGKLIPELTAIAKNMGFDVIDIYHPLQGILDYYAEDGIHMSAPGQEIIASKIVEYLKFLK